MMAKLTSRNLAHRRHFIVPSFVAKHFGYESRRVAAWRFRFLYTSVQSDPTLAGA